MPASASQPSTAAEPGTLATAPSPRASPTRITLTPTATGGAQADHGQPAAKRRRIEQVNETPVSAGDDLAGHDEALPSTEAGDEGRSASAQATEPLPSRVYSRAIIRSPPPAPPVKRKSSKLSAERRGKQRVSDRTMDPVGSNTAGHNAARRRNAAKARKSKSSRGVATMQNVEEAAEELVAAAIGKEKGRTRKTRITTPDNAESVRIISSEVLMSELTKNLRMGRKSTREAELQEMDQAAKEKRRQHRKCRQNGVAQAPLEDPTNDATEETADERLERMASQNRASRAVPNTIIVNGQIRIDESSLQIDRHAAAAAERNAEQLEALDETELTRRVTSSTWLKRDRSGGWGEVLTDQFYEGLRMFGTDFYMISKMFPGKTRHSVKLKFNREEREDPMRIENTLKGERKLVNMDEYQNVTHTVYSDPKEVEREMEEDRKMIEEEQAIVKAAMDEVLKQRADEAAAEAEAADNHSSGKENQVGEEGEGDANADTETRRAPMMKKGRNRVEQAKTKPKGRRKRAAKGARASTNKVRAGAEDTIAGPTES